MRSPKRQSVLRSRCRAYTLLEMLVLVVILGIAGALVIPAMGGTNALRVQAAVRTVVADITFAQSDAVAYQQRRALMFDVDTSSYRVIRVPGDVLDPDVDTLFKRDGPDGLYVIDFNDPRFGGASITDVDVDGDTDLIFDGLGGPIIDPTTNAASAGGYVEITGSGQVFRINIEPFTGRVTVERIAG